MELYDAVLHAGHHEPELLGPLLERVRAGRKTGVDLTYSSLLTLEGSGRESKPNLRPPPPKNTVRGEGFPFFFVSRGALEQLADEDEVPHPLLDQKLVRREIADVRKEHGGGPHHRLQPTPQEKN